MKAKAVADMDTETNIGAETPRGVEGLRVVQAMAGARHGGAEAFFNRLVVALHKAGLDQRVMIRRNSVRAEALRAGGVEPIQAPFAKHFDWRTRWAFKRLIKRYRPHIVLTWMNRATSACPEGDFVHAARLGGYYSLKYYRRCDHLIGNTHDIVDYLVRAGWPAERVHYLPNFVDDTPAPPIERSRFDTPDDAPVALGLGRLHVNKGFDTLLRAAAKVPGLYVWLAGAGPQERELRELARRLGIGDRVRFLGWRSDVASLLATADLFVCSSRHEPLGNVVLEAWAHRVPVVAAASQGPSALIDHGSNGMLVPVDMSEAMASTIQAVLSSPELGQRLVEGGRASFEADFTEAAVVRAYLDFFARVSQTCAASPAR